MLDLEFSYQSDLSFWHVICKHLASRWRGRGQGECSSAWMQQMHLTAFLNSHGSATTAVQASGTVPVAACRHMMRRCAGWLAGWSPQRYGSSR